MARVSKVFPAIAALVAVTAVAAAFLAGKAPLDRTPISQPHWSGITPPIPTMQPEAAMPTKQEEPVPGPLACRLVPVEDGRQHSLFERYPFPPPRLRFAKPRTRLNPLLSDLIEVRLENRSPSAVELLSTNPARPFSAIILLEDSEGHPVGFSHYGPNSLKRLGHAEPNAGKISLPPGGGATQLFRIWARLNKWDVPKAGTYFARANVSYYRASDGQDCRIESPRLRVTIDEDEIREYLAYCKMVDESGVVPTGDPK